MERSLDGTSPVPGAENGLEALWALVLSLNTLVHELLDELELGHP